MTDTEGTEAALLAALEAWKRQVATLEAALQQARQENAELQVAKADKDYSSLRAALQQARAALTKAESVRDEAQKNEEHAIDKWREAEATIERLRADDSFAFHGIVEEAAELLRSQPTLAHVRIIKNIATQRLAAFNEGIGGQAGGQTDDEAPTEQPR